ncbi:MAG: MBL fold metallo-hydrolase [Thiotrichales bacterium]
MSSPFTDLGHGITCIDTGYNRDRFAACYLVTHAGRGAFIDTGTANSLPRMLEAIGRAGLRPEDVDYVMPTHVHLDHAGGAGMLMRHLPHAKLVMHPRGAPHMIDPTRLIAGATAVYGEDGFRASFGELPPVDADRILIVEDDAELALGGRRFQFLETPGHANHHYCVWDARSRGFFTGDTFGIAYPDLAVDGKPYLFPPTTPVQFDPEAWHASVARMAAFDPECLYLTHFGKVEGVAFLAGELHRRIDEYAAIAHGARHAQNRYGTIRASLRTHVLSELAEHGCRLNDAELDAVLKMDLDLNAQGLEVWLARLDRQGKRH